MTMEISISTEGWQSIQDNLDGMNTVDLVEAIIASRLEDSSYKPPQEVTAFEARERESLRLIPHDILVQECYRLVEKHRSCSNDFRHAYIDKAGAHTVPIGE